MGADTVAKGLQTDPGDQTLGRSALMYYRKASTLFSFFEDSFDYDMEMGSNLDILFPEHGVA